MVARIVVEAAVEVGSLAVVSPQPPRARHVAAAIASTSLDPGDKTARTLASVPRQNVGISRATFYYDLGSPYAYLSAERISAVFDEAGAEHPEWVPILLGGLFASNGRSSWGEGPDRDEGMHECERRASAYGLPPIRWPEPWPGNMLFAMRVATFAKEIGRSVSLPLAAFRQQFAAGRDLSEPDNVYIAAASAELHPRSLKVAVERDAIKQRLKDATAAADERGVFGVPSVVVGDEVFWGDDRLEEAVEAAAR